MSNRPEWKAQLQLLAGLGVIMAMGALSLWRLLY